MGHASVHKSGAQLVALQPAEVQQVAAWLCPGNADHLSNLTKPAKVLTHNRRSWTGSNGQHRTDCVVSFQSSDILCHKSQDLPEQHKREQPIVEQSMDAGHAALQQVTLLSRSQDPNVQEQQQQHRCSPL